MVATVNFYTGGQWSGWIRLYNLTFLVGLAMSFCTFWALNRFFPPHGLGQALSFVEGEVIYGVPKTGVEDQSGYQNGEKEVAVAKVV